jgi:predicted helicase
VQDSGISSTKWVKLKAVDPHYFFVPKDFSLQLEYEKFWKIIDIYKECSFGVTTSRDHFVVGFTTDEVIQRLRVFTGNLPDNFVKEGLRLKDTGTWNFSKIRQKAKNQKLEDEILPYAYRPFDNRWICYEASLIERDRRDIMQHIISKENLGLNLTRKLRDPIWQHAYPSSYVTDKTILSSRDNCYFFPLYLYPQKTDSKKHSSSSTMMLFEPKADYNVKKPNLSKILLEQLTINFKKEPVPEQIFFYIYAVLYSSIYRTKYAEFLKIDFPRVPFTKDFKLFQKMSDLGKELTELHLLKSKTLSNPISRFQGNGTNEVEKLRYDEKEKKIYINKNRYFDGIEKEVWEYQIGGYQVCDKWLKDRKGRILTLDDIRHYCKVVTALKKTIEIQNEIDNLYPQIEKRLIEFEK